MSRAALLCPGRGSYTEASLGSLPDDPRIASADAIRAELGLESLLELDRSERFSPTVHLRPAHAAALIYVTTVLDAEAVFAERDVVCVGGNSLGWYTALALAGALDFEDGFRLVQNMALFQEGSATGGQVIYPVVGDDWRPDPDRVERVRALLEAHPDAVFPSIHLGGYAVLAATDEGLALLKTELPEVTLGRATYPFRLAHHGPYHTRLAEPASRRGRAELSQLHFRRPHTTLIDGRGQRFTPWSTDLDELVDYTLGTQVVEPFDFTTCVRTALREFAPERVVLPRPGNTLGGVIGQVVAAMGWRDVTDRAGFDALQKGPAPLVESRGR